MSEAKPALTLQQLQTSRRFVPALQMQTIMELIGPGNPERDFFVERMIELCNTFDTMPTTGQADGDQAIIHLHYFTPAGNFDWWITEKDENHAQHQTFGVADMGCRELGYINLVDLVRSRHVELDLHWKPVTVADVMAKEVFEA